MKLQKTQIILVGTLGALLLVLMSYAYSLAAAPIPESADPTQLSAATDFGIGLPVIFYSIIPTSTPPAPGTTKKTLFCSNAQKSIPDNDPTGVSSTIIIDDPRYMADLDIRLDIDHSWVGDLSVKLAHQESGTNIELIHRPGSPPGSTEQGCRLNNIKSILDDDVSLPVENECSGYPSAIGITNYIEVAIAGSYLPNQQLSSFDGEFAAGNWTLNVSDLAPHDSGKLQQWCIAVELSETSQVPEPPPPPAGLPKSAQVNGVTGQGQGLNLDCESRSAVDWANYFNIHINEYEFFYGLPLSDNPNKGFVGNVNGVWGQIPPADYGVHAEPIAKRLRQYGLPADAEQNITWNRLKAEIAAGRPVIVWILGSGAPRYYYGDNYAYDYIVNGIPEYHISGDGELSTVARFEHTVVLTGYTQDSVSFLNGGTIYQKPLKQFLESWSALGNMAVIYQP